MLNEFKKFAFRGNVLDLAVGVIIGAAFGKIVSSLVTDIMMPIIALVFPSKPDFTNLASKLVLTSYSLHLLSLSLLKLVTLLKTKCLKKKLKKQLKLILKKNFLKKSVIY